MDQEIPNVSGESYIDLALDTIKQKRQALIFNNSKRGAEKSAEDISKYVKDENKKWKEISEELLHVLSSPTKQCRRLAKCAEKGVAFHHSGLTSRQREIIEDNFRTGDLMVISSTPTISMGLDLPAYRAIIRDTKRYEKRGMRDIPVMEYHQICGRAGRPGKESEGQAIVVCSNEKQAKVIINKYIYGKPEDILSKLAVEPVLRMYLLSLVSTEFISDKKGMIDFFSESFWAHQYEDIFEIEKILEHTVDLLSEWNFIETDKKIEKKDNFLSALSLGSNSNYKLIATRLGKRISELYIDPLSAYELIINLRRANDSDSELFSYIYSIISTNEMKPYLGVKQNEWDKIEMRAELMKKEIPSEVPEAWDEEYEDFLSLIKMCFLIESWIDERGEDWILENYSIRPGELQYKLQNADWLLYCSQEISRMLELKNSQRKLSELRLRVKYGVKKELLALLKLKGIGRVRARILYASKIKDLGDVKKADIKVLARLVGPELAKSVKEQVGENVKIDSKDLRKELAKKKSGQLVLGDYGA